MNTFSRRNLLVAISVAVIAILVILSGILANKYRETSGNVKEKEAVVTEKDFGMAKNPIIWRISLILM